jgi:hypothetical protein
MLSSPQRIVRTFQRFRLPYADAHASRNFDPKFLCRNHFFSSCNGVELSMNRLSFLCLLVLVCVALVAAAKKAKTEDPRECEVCVSNLEQIDKLIPADKKSDKAAIEKATGTHCTLSGFGSEWKPNPALTSPKDVKMCYIFEPIKKSISTPFAMGMPKKKVCQRLKKDNPEVCEVKYRKFTTCSLCRRMFLTFSVMPQL